jgi:hypothetical protein
MPFDRKMKHHDEFRTEPGIYFLYNKQGLVLYVGKANNLRARLAKHEADHDVVRSWISFFDEHFERLNIRVRKAAQCGDVTSFDAISRIMAWPLAIIGSKQAIDCCYDTVDSIKSDRCSPEELDLEEFKHIRSLKPSFNFQYNGEVADSDRWKYFPAKYLKSKALSNLVSHYVRRFAMQTLGEN